MRRSLLLMLTIFAFSLHSGMLLAEAPLFTPQSEEWVGVYLHQDFLLGEFQQLECDVCESESSDAYRNIEVFDVAVESRCVGRDCESADDTRMFFRTTEITGLNLDGHTVLMSTSPYICDTQTIDCGPGTDYTTTRLPYLLIEMDGDFCDPHVSNQLIIRDEAMLPPFVKAELLCYNRQEIEARIEERRQCELDGGTDCGNIDTPEDNCSALSPSSSGLFATLLACLFFLRRSSPRIS